MLSAVGHEFHSRLIHFATYGATCFFAHNYPYFLEAALSARMA